MGAALVAEARLHGDRELRGIAQTRIPEDALALHLEIRNVSIPIRHAAPATAPRVQVHAGETVRRRNQRRRRFAVRPERLSVEIELRIELARTPTGEHLFHRGFVDAEQLCERAEIRRERDNRADIQIPVRPSIEPMSDPGREGIVYCGMTERTL